MRNNRTTDVINDFRNKRNLAMARQEACLAEVHAAIPEIAEIDSEIEKLSLGILSSVLSGTDPNEAVDNTKKQADILKSKRTFLLKAHGYTPDYTDIHYECNLCQDTGFIDLKQCTCLKKALSAAALDYSGLSHLVKTQTFDSFLLDYYENGVPRNLAFRNLAALKTFAENFDTEKGTNFLLIGDTGLGKTHLSTAVAKTVMDKGFKVAYDSASDIMADFEAEHFKDTVTEDELKRRYLQSDLLIIDDLGCEMITQFTVSCVYNLLNSRLNRGLSTIINTNLAQGELREKYTDRITSRMFGHFKILLFKGIDIRLQKLK